MELLRGLKYRSAFLTYIPFSENSPIPNSQESPCSHTGTENSIPPLPIDWIMGTYMLCIGSIRFSYPRIQNCGTE